MNAIPNHQDLDDRLVGVLYTAIRQPLAATAVMDRVGIKISIREPGGQGGKYVHPHSAYVRFCCALSRISRAFELRGYVVRKTGGSPFDDGWLEPQGVTS